jgi:hypothetical protein
MAEYGKDIRFIAPWKKWVVWDKDHWIPMTGRLYVPSGRLPKRIDLCADIRPHGWYDKKCFLI